MKRKKPKAKVYLVTEDSLKLVPAEHVIKNKRGPRSDRGKRHVRRRPRSKPTLVEVAHANKVSRSTQYRLEHLARHSPILLDAVREGKLSAGLAIQWLKTGSTVLPPKEWLREKRTRGRRLSVHIPPSRLAVAPVHELTDDSLYATTHFDPAMAALADRHYSRRTPGARQFLSSGRKLVLRNAAGTILFGSCNGTRLMPVSHLMLCHL
jgi:hypothetical protein